MNVFRRPGKQDAESGRNVDLDRDKLEPLDTLNKLRFWVGVHVAIAVICVVFCAVALLWRLFLK